MRLEQTIRETVIAESADLDSRLQQLVRAGLMPQNTLPLLRKSIAKVQTGIPLQGMERDVMATFINSMMFIVLGDDAIFNRARSGARSYATEAKEEQEYDYEGDMAMSQLKSIIANSQKMHDMLDEETNLPEWVQSKITLAEDYITTASNYMQGEMNEEQIDELSKDTMGRYIKKAADRMSTQGVTAGLKIAKDERSQKNFDTISKRARGISTAVKKLTKEDAENLDELSRATVGRYSMKAKSIADNEGGKDRTKGRELAGRKKWGGTMSGVKPARVPATEETQIDELSRERLTKYKKQAEKQSGKMFKKMRKHLNKAAQTGIGGSTNSEKSAKETSLASAAYNKGLKRTAGAAMASKKLAKEEVEQVDEISKATMGRYVNRAKDQIDATSYRQGHRDSRGAGGDPVARGMERKLSKRHKGIETAVKKLTKESRKTEALADISAIKQMNESYKTTFDAALEKYGIKSPTELDENTRKEFFNFVDQEYKKGDK